MTSTRVTSSASRFVASPRARCGVALAAAALFACGLTARAAHALTGDYLVVEPNTTTMALYYNWASNTAPAGTTINLAFSPTTRTAYTQAAPLALPCDLTQFNTGMVFRNVSSQSLYVEMGGRLYINGDERQPITNVYGQTEALAPISAPLAAGAVGTGGFIFVAQPPLFDFLASQLPANVPLKVRMFVRGYTDTAWDFSRGGFFASAAVPETVVWNNTYFAWVRRTCPSS